MKAVSQHNRLFEELAMRSAIRWTVAALVTLVATSAAAVQGDGLLPAADKFGPRWQGRLSVGTDASLLRAESMQQEGNGLHVHSASLLGDYYFARSLRGTGSASGFRATSGLLLGARSTLLLVPSPAALFGSGGFSVERRPQGLPYLPGNPAYLEQPAVVPYLGVGYSSLFGKGNWGFSADIGLMALDPGSAVKLGRVLGIGQSLDDTLRDMRLSPLLQLGVSYSF
jgi:hypothetical protein